MTKENKKLVAQLVALSLIAGGTIYENVKTTKDYKVDESLKKVVDIFEDDTKLDEAVEKDIATYNNMSIIEAADYLEESIEIVEKLENYDFSEVKDLDELTKEECTFAETLTKEDISILMQVIDSKNEDSLELQEAKLKAIKMLEHLKITRENWIEENGRKIVLKTLSWTVKSSVAEELGLQAEEIQDIEIPPSKKITDMNFYVTYNDEKYNISTKAGNVFDSLLCMYQIKSTKDLGNQEYEIYKTALNSSKVLTMTGINSENNKLTNERTVKEAKKILKMN